MYEEQNFYYHFHAANDFQHDFSKKSRGGNSRHHDGKGN